MKVAVGSNNPVKISAVKRAFEDRIGGDVEVVSQKVETGVSDQPFNDETLEGAKNRALAVKKAFKADFMGMDIRATPAYETSMFGAEIPEDGNGTVFIEGGSKRANPAFGFGNGLIHSWYASVTLKDFKIVKVQ